MSYPFIFKDKKTSAAQISIIRSLVSTNLQLYDPSDKEFYWQRMNAWPEELEAIGLGERLKKLPLEDLKALHNLATGLFRVYQINDLHTKVDIISCFMSVQHEEGKRIVNLAMKLLPIFNPESERIPAEYNVHTVVLSLGEVMKLPEAAKKEVLISLQEIESEDQGIEYKELEEKTSVEMDAHSKIASRIYHNISNFILRWKFKELLKNIKNPD